MALRYPARIKIAALMERFALGVKKIVNNLQIITTTEMIIVIVVIFPLPELFSITGLEVLRSSVPPVVVGVVSVDVRNVVGTSVLMSVRDERREFGGLPPGKDEGGRIPLVGGWRLLSVRLRSR